MHAGATANVDEGPNLTFIILKVDDPNEKIDPNIIEAQQMIRA